MDTSLQRLVSVGILFSTLPTVMWLLSEDGGFGPGGRNLLALARLMRQEHERGESLRAAHEETRARLVAQRQIAVELSAAQLTLPEAVARLRDLARGDSDLRFALRRRDYGAATDEEVFYRQAIKDVRGLKGDGCNRGARLRQLDAELDRYLKCAGRCRRASAAH